MLGPTGRSLFLTFHHATNKKKKKDQLKDLKGVKESKPGRNKRKPPFKVSQHTNNQT